MAHELSILSNAAGEPDIEHYIREAKLMRHQAFADCARSSTDALKKLVVAILRMKLDFKRQNSFGTLLGH